jgi:hypothetical protein
MSERSDEENAIDHGYMSDPAKQNEMVTNRLRKIWAGQTKMAP